VRIWFAEVATGTAATVMMPIFAAESRSAFDATGVDIAVGGGQPTIVWVDQRAANLSNNPWTAIPCIHAMQPPSPPRTLRCLETSPFASLSGDFIKADIAWTGSEYVLVWNRLGVAYAERFDRNLNSMDPQPVEVAWNIGNSRVRIVRSGDALTIAYTRTDAGDDERAFARTLETSDQPPPTRRRGVRH